VVAADGDEVGGIGGGDRGEEEDEAAAAAAAANLDDSDSALTPDPAACCKNGLRKGSAPAQDGIPAKDSKSILDALAGLMCPAAAAAAIAFTPDKSRGDSPLGDFFERLSPDAAEYSSGSSIFRFRKFASASSSADFLVGVGVICWCWESSCAAWSCAS
jgi:hypothetical protein